MLSDPEFRGLCRYWLGVPLLPMGRTLPPCPACGKAVDPFGDHFVTCMSNGCTERHNELRDALSALMAKARVAHEVEAGDGTGRRPADLLLKHFSGGHDVAVDITVTSCMQVAEHPLDARKAKVFLVKAEKDKVRANTASCTRMHWECRGLAFSPWGVSGSAATALVRNLLDRATVDETGWPKQRARQELACQLAFAMVRRVAKQLDMRRRVGDLLA